MYYNLHTYFPNVDSKVFQASLPAVFGDVSLCVHFWLVPDDQFLEVRLLGQSQVCIAVSHVLNT